MTTEEMLALPDTGMDRELYDGELVESPAILHGRLHASAVANISQILAQASERQAPPLGMVFTGDVGCILHRDPELFNEKQKIAAEPHLPGFKVAVAKMFA